MSSPLYGGWRIDRGPREKDGGRGEGICEAMDAIYMMIAGTEMSC